MTRRRVGASRKAVRTMSNVDAFQDARARGATDGVSISPELRRPAAFTVDSAADRMARSGQNDRAGRMRRNRSSMPRQVSAQACPTVRSNSGVLTVNLQQISARKDAEVSCALQPDDFLGGMLGTLRQINSVRAMAEQ